MATSPSARLTLFGRRGSVITPGATDFNTIAKSVVMLSAGDITVVPEGNASTDTLTFVGLAAGQLVPFHVRRVTACTGTCASIDD